MENNQLAEEILYNNEGGVGVWKLYVQSIQARLGKADFDVRPISHTEKKV